MTMAGDPSGSTVYSVTEVGSAEISTSFWD